MKRRELFQMEQVMPEIKYDEKIRICIICEGDEEYDYLNALLKLNVFADIYSIELTNAGGNGNIFPLYQSNYQNDTYDLIIAFCDTDKAPHDQYNLIKSKLDDLFGFDDASEQVIIYSNPCVMQIILLHWDDVKLRTQAKKVNSPVIEKYTGVKNYKAKASQRKKITDQITINNFNQMLDRVRSIETSDEICPSTNIGIFLRKLINSDNKWIGEINSILDSAL